MTKRIEQLRELKRVALLGGGEEKLAEQRAKGKTSGRDRVDRLLDPGSFVEHNLLAGGAAGADGCVEGHGTIDGRRVCIYSQDPTVMGGSIGALHGNKMYNAVENALNMGVPLIGLHDSAGARTVRVTEQKKPEPGEARQMGEKGGSSIFFINTQASGVVPQIGAVLGSCAGIAVYSPALHDFILMVDQTSHMFITGPRIVKSVMSEDLTMEQLGGARVHAQKSGVAHFRSKTEDDCLETIKRLLSFLPSNCRESPPRKEPTDDPDRMCDDLGEIVPSDPNKPFDMHRIVKSIADNGDFLEVHAEFAGEMIVGYLRLDGYPVGIVANNPMVRAGSLTVDSSDKQARFMRTCDCFNVPLVFLVDTPAYMPGSFQEHSGIIRHGAKVLYALSEHTVPRIDVLIRKTYGGGNLGMGVTPGLGYHVNFSWPIHESGVMGAEQTVDLFYTKQLAEAANPQELREKLIKDYRERMANPFQGAATSTNTSDIIEPRETRQRLIKELSLLRLLKIERYPKRHGNIPL
ncbi:MAG: acyl-CoA carboxylase subunit beta [Chloroflexota bacterium]